MAVPREAFEVRFAFLPPMSGLSSSEAMLQPGTVNVLLGQGRTAEVLRNLLLPGLRGAARGMGFHGGADAPTVRSHDPGTLCTTPSAAEITLRYRDARMPNLELGPVLFGPRLPTDASSDRLHASPSELRRHAR